MANIKSQIKRVKTNAKRQDRNKAVKSEVKTFSKKSLAVISDRNIEEATMIVAKTVSLLDKAASKGVYHKNAVAKKKSALAKKLNNLIAEGPAETATATVEAVEVKSKATKTKTAKTTKTTTAAKKSVTKEGVKKTTKSASKAKKDSN